VYPNIQGICVESLSLASLWRGAIADPESMALKDAVEFEEPGLAIVVGLKIDLDEDQAGLAQG
jgi:hypothetical protein